MRLSLRKLIFPIVFLTIAFLGNIAIAGVVQAPVLEKGKFVYTIPQGFEPPLIGYAGLSELQEKAKSLHFPFYVVIAEQIPVDDDEGMAKAIDGLAEDWQNSRSNMFDASKSQIFLLSYEPRKYRFLAGATFKTQLGFERGAHKPYTDIFDRSVHGTPKDPKGGILAMMAAVDAYLVDQTDPVKIAERQARLAAQREAERKAAEQKRLDEARSELDGQIARLADLLAQKEYLPSDVSGYQITLATTKEIRAQNQNQVQNLLSAATTAKMSADQLDNYVRKQKNIALAKALESLMIWLFCFVAFGMAVYFALNRRKKFIHLKLWLKKICEEQKAEISNASGQYMRLYNEREKVAALTDVQGETKELYDSVTIEVDAIYSAVKAMDSHIDLCIEQASKASYWNFAPIEKAQRDLNGEFEFDTGELNKADLFCPETKRIRIVPSVFEKELDKRFKASVDGWERLKLAANAQLKSAKESFPEDNLDKMLQLAKEQGIPQQWLNDHPLIGDDASDQTLYQQIDALRWSDPLAYLLKLDSLRDKESEISKRLDRLVNAINLSKLMRLEVSPATGDTVMDPSDDPRVTFDNVRGEENKMAGLIATSDNVEEIEKKANDINILYHKCVEQKAMLDNAIKEAGKTISAAQTLQAQTKTKREVTTQRAEEYRKIYRNCDANDYVLNGNKYFESAFRDLEKADIQLKEKRYLNSRRNADKASEEFQEALRQYQEANAHCDALDVQKRNFEEKLKQMSDIREQTMRRVQRYGGSASSVGDFQKPMIGNGAVDYAILLSALASQESRWQDAERSARQGYEEEERRQEEERERQERARRQREEARRRSEESSSGSSWGSSHSSSSGGSWGGGGSSSSGGSW